MKHLLQQQIQQLQQSHAYTSKHPLLYILLVLRLTQLLVAWVRARWYLRSSQQLGLLAFAKGKIHTMNAGELQIKNKNRFWSSIHPTHIHVAANAKLHIGSECFINGAQIAAYEHISIGNGVYLAPMAQLSDSYAHGLLQASEQTAPISIADHAWVATRAIVLPGVHIGKNAVVGVGALVDQDVPDYAVVAGVPARVIRYLDPTKIAKHSA